MARNSNIYYSNEYKHTKCRCEIHLNNSHFFLHPFVVHLANRCFRHSQTTLGHYLSYSRLPPPFLLVAMAVDVFKSYIAAVASIPGVVGSVRSGFFSTKVECKVTLARRVVRLVIKAEDADLRGA
jgi:hypothetical protein